MSTHIGTCYPKVCVSLKTYSYVKKYVHLNNAVHFFVFWNKSFEVAKMKKFYEREIFFPASISKESFPYETCFRNENFVVNSSLQNDINIEFLVCHIVMSFVLR